MSPQQTPNPRFSKNYLSLIQKNSLSLTPWTFAQEYSKGSWIPYKHLIYISEKISTAIWNSYDTGIGGRIIVDMPPRHGKSELISHWSPAWFINEFPDQKVIITTYEENFAKGWGAKVRNTIDEVPEINVEISRDTRAKGYWETSKGGGVLTAGVGGPITGRGFHLGIIDDPIKNWVQAQSDTIRQNIIEWFNSTFYTRADQASATMILLMTRWHEKDLAGYLIKDHEDDWDVIRFPALCESEEDILGRKIGEALCPERFDERALQRIKNAVGSRVWAGLYQQRPAPAEGAIWKLEYWQYYTARPRFQYIIQSWDTGQKTEPGSSYSCCSTWGATKSGYYLLDIYRDKLQYPDLKKQVSIRYQKWNPRPRMVLIEDKSSGTSVIQDLKRSTTIPIKGIKVPSQESKEVRGEIASSEAEAGNVFLPFKARWLADYLDEMTHFPNSEFTDQADSTSQAIDYFTGKSGRIITGAKVMRG